MNNSKEKLSFRWAYMVIGVVAMLFAGILYAWSILKSPLSAEFGWGTSDLALNFTIAMTFFCIGGLVGARISAKAGQSRFSLSLYTTHRTTTIQRRAIWTTMRVQQI